MDSWLQRLMVRGSARSVERFRRAAWVDRRPVYITFSGRLRKQWLSFRRLSRRLLPWERPRELQDPLDLAVEPKVRWGRWWELQFNFQLTRFEPAELLTDVSRGFPDLVFVLGTVAWPMGANEGALIFRGTAERWVLPCREESRIRRRMLKESDDEAVRDMLADFEFLETVVHHWDRASERLLKRIDAEPAEEAVHLPS